MNPIRFPLGIDSFEKLRTNGYYYIDKSMFLSELLTQEAFEVNLITRPRRFGKTLALSMLADFFDIRISCLTCSFRLSAITITKKIIIMHF